MLPFILYEISLFGKGDDPAEARVDLSWFLEALVQRDQDYLKQHPETPQLYKSGVKYVRPAQYNGECAEVATLRQALGKRANEPKVAAVLRLVQMVFGGERFCDIGRIIDKGGIDCDGLAAWRTAELRQRGIRATVVLLWRPNAQGGTTYHALVRWPDGSSEDPSLLLGMGGEERAADRAEEIRKNVERVRMIQTGEMASGGDGASAAAALDDVFGGGGGGHHHGGGGHHHGGGGRGFGGGWYGDPWGWGPDYDVLVVDDDTRTFDELFDDAVLRRTGAMRGGQ